MATPLLRTYRRRPNGRNAVQVHAVIASSDAARPAQLREANCRMLLRLLRSNSPCSKADLVRNSGLSATTVSVGMAHLIDRGLAEELGEGESSGGRPPGLLRFNADHAFVAAADIGGTRLRMMLADLNGQPLAQWTTHLAQRQKTPCAIVALMGAGLKQMLKQCSTVRRVLHLTVGAPGITDVDQGIVVAAPNLQGWTDLPLRNLVERELRISATVENDVNLAAVGECAQGVARGMRDYVFIAIGTGVGAGIFLRGALHHGAKWSAGEIGYLPVAGLPRQTMQLEQTGQLERAIGGAGIELMWHKALKRERQTANESLMNLRAQQVFDLAAEGHVLAREVLTQTAMILSDAISTIALLYNPQMIVLGGGIGSHKALCRSTETLLRRNQFAQPTLCSSSLGTDAQLYGGVATALAATESKLLC